MEECAGIIKKVAREMGCKVKTISERRYCYQVIFRNKSFFFVDTFVIPMPLSVGELTLFKDITNTILSKNNISIPKTVCVFAEDSQAQLKKKISRLKLPLIVKNSAGTRSRGVVANIFSVKESVQIIQKEIKKYKIMLVQEMVFGKEYRVLVLDDKAIGVLQMVPPFVEGDGKTKIIDLIKKKQRIIKKEIPFNKALKSLLRDQGEGLVSIPLKGKKIYLKKYSSLAEGGNTIDCTKQISKSLEKICVRATKLTGAKLAGVDLICDDINKETKDQRYAIIEINRRPDISVHYNPSVGKSVNVAKDILRHIFKKEL